MISLEDCFKFRKCLNLHFGATTPGEKEAAARAVSRMEASYPGIREATFRAERAIQAPEPEPKSTEAPAWPGMVVSMLGGVAAGVASQMADEVAGHLSGAGRFEPLKSGELVFLTRACSPDQVCAEVRLLAVDLRRRRTREKMMAALERELSEAAGRAE